MSIASLTVFFLTAQAHLSVSEFPVMHGGTGQHKLSDLAQTRKWHESQRALTGEVALAAYGLLELGMRQLECIISSSLHRDYPSQQHRRQTCLLSVTLIEGGADIKCVPASTHPNHSSFSLTCTSSRSTA